jgi:hypothetical protein
MPALPTIPVHRRGTEVTERKPKGKRQVNNPPSGNAYPDKRTYFSVISESPW